jgi:2-polyprenyl-3-methyl-5-hydroxy-6-metoxy-1,4-benzoquinol methylase
MLSHLQIRADRWNEVAAELTANPLVLERVRYAVALKAILGLPEDSAILDAGCGAGRILRTLEALGYHNVTGLETSQWRLDYVQHAGGTRAKLICSDRVPFEDASFDAVVSAAVIGQVPDARTWLGELARVVKPGGIISITSDAYSRNWVRRLGVDGGARATGRAIRPKVLLDWADEAGLETIACGGFTNVPDQEYHLLKQLKHWLSPRRRYYKWRGQSLHYKPAAAYEHLEELPGILDALDRQPLQTGMRPWQAMFSYESFFYFRKRGESAASQQPATQSPADERTYRAAA